MNLSVKLVIKFSFMCFIGFLPLQSSSFYGSRAVSKDYSSGGTNLDRYELRRIMSVEVEGLSSFIILSDETGFSLYS